MQYYLLNLGRHPYADALDLQRRVAAGVIDGSIPHDVLILVEHPPVITLGRSTKGEHMLTAPGALANRGVEVHEIERGGDVTFHGPGQLVGYPIIDLKRHKKDLHWYLRQLEEVLIQAVGEFGVVGERREGYTGVWVSGGSNFSDEGIGNREWDTDASNSDLTSKSPIPHSLFPRTSRRKLASIGVHARDWVTWHGFALNVTTDLSYFDLIVPCGIPNVTMTSLAQEVPSAGATLNSAASAVLSAFGSVFSLDASIPVTPNELLVVGEGSTRS